ncbi:MAG TPA: hypothetical protein VK168_16090 [Saprospiraceae bacterium]|nr:hypothetical protein [Saprospiraceae bacterium]
MTRYICGGIRVGNYSARNIHIGAIKPKLLDGQPNAGPIPLWIPDLLRRNFIDKQVVAWHQILLLLRTQRQRSN